MNHCDPAFVTGQKGTTTFLCDWLLPFQWSSVPVEAQTATRLCLVDAMACMIGGIGMESSQAMLRALLNSGAGGDIVLPGSNVSLGVLAAAQLGAHAANALDLDDCFRAGAPSHPGATTIPAALAMGQRQNSSGVAFLEAIVAAYEVSLRIGRAVDASPARKEAVMGYSSWQTFGATVAAGHLASLDLSQWRSAFGLSGAQAPVPAIRKGVDGIRPYSWIKNAYGMATEVGVFAVLLAQEGFWGNQEILDGPGGFWVMSGSDQYRPELAREGLGQDWLVRQVEFKPYACCRWAHTTLEAIGELTRGLSVDSVQRIDVHGFRELFVALGGPLPTTIVDAQFNLPYLCALELSGRSSAGGLREEDLQDGYLAQLASKVYLHHAPEYDALHENTMATPVRVVLTDVSGREASIYMEEPPSSVKRGGFDESSICQKYIRVTTPIIGKARAEQSLAIMLNMERWNVNALLQVLSNH